MIRSHICQFSPKQHFCSLLQRPPFFCVIIRFFPVINSFHQIEGKQSILHPLNKNNTTYEA
jgi:hypothetical protein